MFTGIVEELGCVAAIEGGAQWSRLLIQANKVLEDVRLGDSIAVNGVCLTVTSFTSTHFTADVMPETMKKTSLGRLKRGQVVNLERAMAMGDRFGGHIVSGHIDGTGVILSREPHANAVLFHIQAPRDLHRYMVARGSITVDGISLTIVDTTGEGFTISIIPHTLGHTNLRDKYPGDIVNLECDIIGKYIERLLLGPVTQGQPQRAESLGIDFLREHGFA